MKISSLGNGGPGGKFSVNTDKASNNLDTPMEFANTLKNMSQKLSFENLQRLIEEVDKTAKKLAKSCTITDLRAYKRAVKNFLKETLGNAFAAQEETGWDRAGRQKIYVIVKKVDESLEELSHEVLKEQNDQLTILKKIDEIRGLLVDMYM